MSIGQSMQQQAEEFRERYAAVRRADRRCASSSGTTRSSTAC
jgi:hypothetical protein